MKTRTKTFGLLALAMTVAACAQNPGAGSTMSIVSPAAGAKVKGPKVTVMVDVKGFTLVPANQAPVVGEGHVHFFVDTPASTVPVGKVVPLDHPWIASARHIGICMGDRV